MKQDHNGSKKWYAVARDAIGTDKVDALIELGICLRCSDEQRSLEQTYDRMHAALTRIEAELRFLSRSTGLLGGNATRLQAIAAEGLSLSTMDDNATLISQS